jgi:hypothetical protein
MVLSCGRWIAGAFAGLAVLVPASLAWACVAPQSLTTSSPTVQPGGTVHIIGRESGPGAPIEIHLDAADQMTKDLEGPARAFTGPTSMAADPENPRIVVAATAELRSRQCYLAVSKDAGTTWHFSEQPPTDPAYPYCTNTTAGVPHAVVAWRRNHTLGSISVSHLCHEDRRQQAGPVRRPAMALHSRSRAGEI